MKFLVFAIALLSLSMSARPAQKAVDVPRISRIPESVRSKMKRGGRTHFFGKAPIGVNKSDVWLHFYKTPTQRRKSKKADASYEFNPHDYVLNVFENVGKAKRVRLRLLNSVFMSGDKFFVEDRDKTLQVGMDTRYFDYVVARTLWLHPSANQTAVVWLRCGKSPSTNAYTIENDLLLIFTQGLTKQPIIQEFENSANYDVGVENNYEDADEQGQLMVTRKKSVPQFLPFWTEVKLQWNGQLFVEKSRREIPYKTSSPKPEP